MPPASRRAGTAVRSWSPESPRRSPGDDRLRDLGEHRLKDLSAPERVYQLGADDFPPLKSLYQTNLPVPSTPFLGREEELSRVLELLGQEEVRLLTLTGPGGTGKTRLALQAAGSAADAYPAGVWWVSLSPLRDSDLVLATASQALGASGALTEHIGSKRMLILFDNFEHVIDAASGVGELLQACPELDVLATSREHLHLAAEREYAVPPLNPPEGVAFFSARAQAVRADFEADGVIEEICRRLDDLPLALELAAARVKALSPAQILASGWNILVRHTQQRFWMLESIREYAAEQLAESDEADELRNGHALHFLGVAESTGLSLEPLVEQHYDVAAGEIDNLRAALVWLSEKDAELALRLATALDAFWLVTDPSEGMRWYAALLERAAEAPPELRARALLAYGGSANPAGDDELAERLYQQSHDLFREVGNDEGVAVTLLRLGYSAFYRGDSERAGELARESLDLSREVGYGAVESQALGLAGEVDFARGNREAGAGLIEQSAILAGEVGFPWWRSRMLRKLVDCWLELGQLGKAEDWARESLGLLEQTRDRQMMVFALSRVARIAAESGRLEEAGYYWGAIEAEEERSSMRAWAKERERLAAPVLAHAGPEFEEGRAQGREVGLDGAVERALGRSERV